MNRNLKVFLMAIVLSFFMIVEVDAVSNNTDVENSANDGVIVEEVQSSDKNNLNEEDRKSEAVEEESLNGSANELSEQTDLKEIGDTEVPEISKEDEAFQKDESDIKASEADKNIDKDLADSEDSDSEEREAVEKSDNSEAADENSTTVEDKDLEVDDSIAAENQKLGVPEDNGQTDDQTNEASDPLDDYADKIANEKDTEKNKELQKEYIAEVGKSEKLDSKILERFTDNDKIKEFYEIQDEYENLKKKAESGILGKEDVQKFNEDLRNFKVPRLLNEDEKDALDQLHETPYIPRIAENSSDEAKEIFTNYQNAKEALEKALDPNGESVTKEELQKLTDDFNKAKKALIDGISDGSIKTLYTEGSPEIKVFPLDYNGKPGDELDKDTYYIPDNTDLNLLVQVNKDEDEENTFTFTIKPKEIAADIPDAIIKKLVFLNGKAADLVKNDDGSYSFTTDVEFGIAQLRFNMPGFKAAFHSGFELEMKAGNEDPVTKKFLITKKGYEDADLVGPGSNDPDKAPEIDAGSTTDSIVDGNTNKVFDFFTIIKESKAYIDEVIFNSSDGQSIPLSSVDITIRLPEYNGKAADYIHKSGLEYQDNGDGSYTLKLKIKDFGGNLEEKDGKFYLDGKELTEANLKDVILQNGKDKVYIDENNEAHNIEKEEYYLSDNENYKIENNTLYEKNIDGKYDELGTFKNGKLTVTKKLDNGTEGKVFYEFKNGMLIAYTEVYDAYQGNVSNKGQGDDEKAEPSVTPTLPGDQVIIKEDGKKSYGGTIVENGIFEDGIYSDEKSGEGYTGYKEAYIDQTGKIFITNSEVTDNGDGTVTIDGKTYKVVKNSVFNKDGYIVSGLEYKEGFTLIDKFGRAMDITVVKNGDKYTFSRKGETDVESEDGRVSISGDQIFVGNDNYIIDPATDYKAIIGNYYYDGKKFIKIEDDKALKGNKFYKNFLEMTLKKHIAEFYKDQDGNKVVLENIENIKQYFGSTDKNDYYTVNDKIYLKKTQGKLVYYVSVDQDGNEEILSTDEFSKIVQVLKVTDQDGNTKEVEVVTDETSILDAVNNAKFQLRFPDFLAGKDVLYNISADIKAKYYGPSVDEDGNREEISVFKDQAGNEIDEKTITKYFTLKVTKTGNSNFFKNPPKELQAIPDYNFFNIFYRGKDSERYDIIKDLLESKEELEKNPAEQGNKEKLDLLEKIQSELGRLYNGAKFVLNESGDLEIHNKNGEVIEIDHSLLWEVGFKNTDGGLFPEDSDTTIVIDDSNMDNRLVYDEIILNDSKDNWDKAKEEWEKAQIQAKEEAEARGEEYEIKEFQGTDQYFFIDQIAKIQFGVNSNFVDNIFTAVAGDYTLDSDDLDKIVEALHKGETEYKKGDITYKISLDKDKGQIRIKVLDLFYKKVEDEDHKFESPVQKEYTEKLNEAIKIADGLDTRSKDSLKDGINNLIEKFYHNTTDCFGVLKEKFGKLIDEISDEDSSEKLKKIREDIVEEITKEKYKLIYLDNKKGEYKFDDMRFNAMRFILKPNITIGGAIDPAKTKKIGITSIIVDDVEIPFTDEFGNPLTNKDMYVNYEIEKILKEGLDGNPIKISDFKNKEDIFRKVMAEAYKRVNDKIDSGEIKIKDLVTIDENGKYETILGSDLAYEDLAPNKEESLKDKAGDPINPYYVGDAKDGGTVSTIEDKLKENLGLTDAEFENLLKEKDIFKEVVNQKIDLAAYYMNKQGANRGFYANKANYFLAKGEQGSGIFGKEDNWKNKICCSGILGKCLENAGGATEPGQDEDGDNSQNEGNAESKFELTYTPSHKGPEEEKPKLDKDADNSNVDLSDDNDLEVDFTIDITVDKLDKDQKKLADSLNPNNEKTDYSDYNDNGFFEYKDALIIDILPDIFELKDGSTIKLLVDRMALMANGANAAFKDEGKFNEFVGKIEYFYTDDVYNYLQSLDDSDPRKAVLEKALESKLEEGTKQQAVLAWLPNFEAPHGSKKQFSFKLEVLVNKDKYQEAEDKLNAGQIYTNHAIFGNVGDFLSGKKDIVITDGHEGDVNKYLQILDKDGNPISKEGIGEWFKGNVSLKFGDKFNYKIKVYFDNNIIDTGIGNTNSEWELDDVFANKEENGLRPILRDFVQVPEGFLVEYKIGEKTYSEEELRSAIEDGEVSLAQVTSIKLKAGKGGFPNRTTQDFIIPMMIPELDAKVENGKVYYIGVDGNMKELGDAEDFFNLGDLTDKEKELFAENKVDDSNTVKVYLEKERLIKLIKEFYDQEGNTIKEDRPEVKFDVYQIVKDENGNVVEKIKLDKQLTLNEANEFMDKIDHLPLFKKFTMIDENGNVIVKILDYTYEVHEVEVPGYDSKIFKLDKDDALGFVLKAEKPNEPGTPPDKPDKPNEPGTPPEKPNEPGTPPSNSDRPESPESVKEVNSEDIGLNQNKANEDIYNIPKTGLYEDVFSIYLGLALLLGLVFIKRKYIIK